MNLKISLARVYLVMIYVSFTNKKNCKGVYNKPINRSERSFISETQDLQKMLNKIEDTKNKMELRERIFYKLNVSRKGHAFLLIH